MKSIIIAFLTGATCGALAILLIKTPTDPAPASDLSSASSAKANVLQDEIADLTHRLANAEKQVADAASRPATLNDPQMATHVFRSGDDSEIAMAEIQKQIMQQQEKRIERKVAAQLASLKSRLNLTGDQENAIREILKQKESNSGTAGILSMAISAADSGDVSISNLVGGDADGPAIDYDGEIRALLNDEQAASYDAYLAERRANSIESQANQRLAQLQQSLDLSPEQKDQAFKIFTETAQNQLSSDREQGASMFTTPKEEKEAFRQILSPEQMEVYEQTPQIMSIISSDGDILSGDATIMGISTETKLDIKFPAETP